MKKQKIYFLIISTILLFSLLKISTVVEGAILWPIIGVVFVPTIFFTAVWGIIIYQFRNGVQMSGDIITIPQMFGHITLKVSHIRSFEAKKSTAGVLLDYSTLTILTENGAFFNVLLPDVIVDQLKTKFQTEKT